VLTEQLGNTARRANAHALLSATLFDPGEVEPARLHAERGRALFDPEAPPLQTDVGIQSCILLGSACVYLGRIAQVRATNRGSARMRRQTRHPVSPRPGDEPGGAGLHAARRRAGSALTRAGGPPARQRVRLLDDPNLGHHGPRAWTDVEQGRVEDELPVLEGAFAVPAEGRRDCERPRSGRSVSFRRSVPFAEKGVCRALENR
jgi:hypothetical protein